jgi:hypothetical protein
VHRGQRGISNGTLLGTAHYGGVASASVAKAKPGLLDECLANLDT